MNIVIQLDDYVHREICFNLMSFTTFRLYNYFHISILKQNNNIINIYFATYNC